MYFRLNERIRVYRDSRLGPKPGSLSQISRVRDPEIRRGNSFRPLPLVCTFSLQSRWEGSIECLTQCPYLLLTLHPNPSFHHHPRKSHSTPKVLSSSSLFRDTLLYNPSFYSLFFGLSLVLPLDECPRSLSAHSTWDLWVSFRVQEERHRRESSRSFLQSTEYGVLRTPTKKPTCTDKGPTYCETKPRTTPTSLNTTRPFHTWHPRTFSPVRIQVSSRRGE